MQIGPYSLVNPVILAPMAGVADAAFRGICLECGAGLAVGEMVQSDPLLRGTAESERRFRASDAEAIPVVQLLGSDPQAMADAARHAVRCGAKIVDINFGCPARIVCGKACGSFLMADTALAERIMAAVYEAVSVPVTVKMRLGWDKAHQTVFELARAAQDIGLAAVTVHGRTRQARFTGPVDYEAIGRLAASLSIPVIANGDIDSAQKVVRVLRETGAGAVMIGRAALGAPWIFTETADALAARPITRLSAKARRDIVLRHFDEHMRQAQGSRKKAVFSFRKHVVRYLLPLPQGKEKVRRILAEQDEGVVRELLSEFLGQAQ